MKNLLTILSLFLLQISYAQTPTANAGVDQTIYLTTTNSVTLTGTATNMASAAWREVSTDYNSGATITSSTSLVTTVIGLPQGNFLFELKVTSATSAVAMDTVLVKVDFTGIPYTGTLLRSMENRFSWIKPHVNIRAGEDTNYYYWGNQTSPYFETQLDSAGEVWYFQRDRLAGQYIGNQKFITTIEDGYPQGTGAPTYSRNELFWSTSWKLDSANIYVFDWKGYFPQDFTTLTANSNVTCIMQIHGNDSFSPPFEFVMNSANGLTFFESSQGGNGSDANVKVAELASLVNQTHTIRLTIKEGKGYPGQDAFVKVEVDGVQKYYRNTGTVGSTIQSDYPKFATLYDYNHALVSPTNTTRHQKFSLVTEGFNAYKVTDTLYPSTIRNFFIIHENETFLKSN